MPAQALTPSTACGGQVEAKLVDACPGDAVPALLLCVPHVGAGPEVFRAWEALGVPGVRVHPVPLPGRDRRLGEEPFTDAIVDEVSPLLSDDRPTVLFGHGLGALLCFELAARFQGRGGPLRLIASGSPDPWNQHVDLLAREGYRPSVPSLTGVPVIALRGDRDDIVSRQAAAGWERATTGPFELRELPGDHFYYLDQGRAVAEMAALAAVGAPAATAETTRAAVARELAELWQGLLGVEDVGVHDDFFDLGGNSNSGLLMVSHAERQGIAITLRDLFRLRTADAIANHCVKPEAP